MFNLKHVQLCVMTCCEVLLTFRVYGSQVALIVQVSLHKWLPYGAMAYEFLLKHNLHENKYSCSYFAVKHILCG